MNKDTILYEESFERRTLKLLNKLIEWHSRAYGEDYSLSDLWTETRGFRDRLIDELTEKHS